MAEGKKPVEILIDQALKFEKDGNIKEAGEKLRQAREILIFQAKHEAKAKVKDEGLTALMMAAARSNAELVKAIEDAAVEKDPRYKKVLDAAREIQSNTNKIYDTLYGKGALDEITLKLKEKDDILAALRKANQGNGK